MATESDTAPWFEDGGSQRSQGQILRVVETLGVVGSVSTRGGLGQVAKEGGLPSAPTGWWWGGTVCQCARVPRFCVCYSSLMSTAEMVEARAHCLSGSRGRLQPMGQLLERLGGVGQQGQENGEAGISAETEGAGCR